MEVAKYISIFVASMLKFFGGPITGMLTNVDMLHCMVLSAAGMMTSVILTSIFTNTISNYFDKKPKTQKLIFSKRARFAVKIWSKLGLFGIAMLTPVLFMPIGGTLLAVSFKAKIPKIIAYMFVSACFWSVLACFFIYKLDFIRVWILG